jgi:hypothetical protein
MSQRLSRRHQRPNGSAGTVKFIVGAKYSAGITPSVARDGGDAWVERMRILARGQARGATDGSRT